jgi:hypothetical protein
MQLSKLIIVCITALPFFACEKDTPLKSDPPYGPYFWDFKNWSAEDSTSVGLNTSSFFGRPIDLTTLDSSSNPMVIEAPSGIYLQPRYELTFTNVGGVYTLTSVAFNDDDVATLASAGIDIADGPNILMADSENQTFELQYTARTTVFSSYTYAYIVDKYYR